jgi:hypothetical protein
VNRLSTEFIRLRCSRSLVSSSLFYLLFLLLRLYLVPFRLNGGFGEGFRLNAFGFSAPSLFFLLHYMALSLPTESRLRSRLTTD